MDHDSARQLGLGEAQEGKTLISLLKELDQDSDLYVDGHIPVWVERHTSAKITRPVVISNLKTGDRKGCSLRILFAPAFGVPTTDYPPDFQRLADGVRLSVRTLLEVIKSYSNSMASIHKQKVLRQGVDHPSERNSRVGSRVISALEAIWQEASNNRIKMESPTPTLFTNADAQASYVSIRARGKHNWEAIRAYALNEDSAHTGDYSKTEALLVELREICVDYIRISIPLLFEMVNNNEF
jgi:hypothetical protein